MGSTLNNGALSGQVLKEMRVHQDLAAKAIANCPPYPEGVYQGQGIVICGGGAKYFPCVWVEVRTIRRFCPNVPIELWYLDSSEMDETMLGLMHEQNVTCRNASEVLVQHPMRRFGGWESKVFAILYSSFQEVLFLDADNIPVRNPMYMLDTTLYHTTGAVFWPDFGRLAKNRLIWDVCRAEYIDEPEFESGQILVDKKACWAELNLAKHLNEYSDYYYEHVHGDKETFHMAWRMLGRAYAMPTRPIDPLEGTMCQHDFDGKRLFQHRNLRKWKLGGNPAVPGFLLEKECLAEIEILRKRWSGVVAVPGLKTEAGRKRQSSVLQTRLFRYERVGYDNRLLELLPGGKVGSGGAKLESGWHIQESPAGPSLVITGGGVVTASLLPDGTGWSGNWLVHERMPVTLRPASEPVEVKEPPKIDNAPKPPPDPVGPTVSDQTVFADFRDRYGVYVKIGEGPQTLRFLRSGDIVGGTQTKECFWQISGGRILVLLDSSKKPLAHLSQGPDRIWRGRHAAKDVELVPIDLNLVLAT